ncbi:cutinase family protein [Nocardia otitidiscaviarum]|uniref:cutinase family protein n=1 Tax=Nocardia otitidiscaviarum TaxID=1823 RepID=UPI001894008B|nr:cutinase family protein [Nocardia otitidiscaviarum]MBF6178801.1 cutinase family protein [Nocardia otitidiscaviarum]
MRLKKIVAAAGAAASVLSGLVLGGSGSAVADPGCPSLYTVAIPGTWETGKDKDPEHGMLSGVTDGLPGRVDYVNYAATAFPWEGDVYGASKAEATANARNLVRAMAARCGSTKIAIVGYSQGADAAGDLAAEIGTGIGPVSPDRVVAVGLLSDPRRSPADIQIGPAAPGAGAGGPRVGGFGWIADRVRTICAIGDLYCSTEESDFVMRFAGFLAQASNPSPASMWRYQQELGAIMTDLMAQGGFPTLQAQLSEDANQQRIEQLRQFYGTGTHQMYGSYPVGGGQTAVSWMHNWIARSA